MMLDYILVKALDDEGHVKKGQFKEFIPINFVKVIKEGVRTGFK